MAKKTAQFNFVPVGMTGLHFTQQLRKSITSELPEGIYWCQPNRMFLWNRELLQHLYLVVGGDRSHPDHQKLVEQFLATLPTSA